MSRNWASFSKWLLFNRTSGRSLPNNKRQRPFYPASSIDLIICNKGRIGRRDWQGK